MQRIGKRGHVPEQDHWCIQNQPGSRPEDQVDGHTAASDPLPGNKTSRRSKRREVLVEQRIKSSMITLDPVKCTSSELRIF